MQQGRCKISVKVNAHTAKVSFPKNKPPKSKVRGALHQSIATKARSSRRITASKKLTRPVRSSRVRKISQDRLRLRKARRERARFELTKHIPKDFAFPKLDEALIVTVAQALNQSDFTHEIFKDKNYPFLLLAAHEKELISTMQFTTGIFISEAMIDYGAERVSLIPLEGNERRFFQGLFLDANTALLDEKQADCFFEKAKKLPSSEQMGIFIDLPEDLDDRYHGILVLNFGAAPVQIFYENGKPKLLVPSFSLLKLFNREAFGDNAVDIYPVLGPITGQYIQNEIDRRHVVGLNIPSSFALDKADGYDMGFLGFSLHDLYHGWRLGYIPKNHRQAFQRINQVITETLQDWEKFTDEKKRGYFFTFRDQDFAGYQTVWQASRKEFTKKILKPSDIAKLQRRKVKEPFWNIENAQVSVAKRIKPFTEKQKKYLQMEAFSKEFLTFLYDLRRKIPKNLFETVVANVFMDMGSWNMKFDIDLDKINWKLDYPIGHSRQPNKYTPPETLSELKQLFNIYEAAGYWNKNGFQ